MAESMTRSYQRLFEVRLIHHYWLDDGGKVFDKPYDDSLLSDEEKKNRNKEKTEEYKRLRKYDVRTFLQVTPTVATAKALKEFDALFKDTSIGFFVATSNNSNISDDTVLDFIVTIRDPSFFNYTALTLRQQKIHEVYCSAENRIYRYKANVPVFSNQTGAKRRAGQNMHIYLSREIPALQADDAIESLVIESQDLWQLTADQPSASKQKLDKADNLPVFVNQADVPVLSIPQCIVEKMADCKCGIMLTEDIPDNVFALIRLSAVRASDSEFSLIKSGKAKNPHPVFRINFKNRSTFLKYVDTGTYSASSLPLTYYGNANTPNNKPSTGVVKVEKGQNGNNTITKLVSEIFI